MTTATSSTWSHGIGAGLDRERLGAHRRERVALDRIVEALGRLRAHTPPDIPRALRDSGADVLVAYLPVGSDLAAKHYAQAALDAGVAFVNALPVFIASDPEWAAKFTAAGIPIVGDDVKSQLGAGTKLPRPSDAVHKVFLTVKNGDKLRAVEVARQLAAMGFDLCATKGTAAAISAAGIACVTVNKVTEGRPHVVDMIKNNEIALVINTVEERRNAIADSRQIRTSALLARVTTFTTIAGAEAAVEGMKYMDHLGVISVQEMHAQLAA